MAIDTVSKRRSMLGLFSPTVRPLPIPDGTINQGDRQHFALMYSGVALGVATTLVGRWAKVLRIRSGNERLDIGSPNNRLDIRSSNERLEL